MKKLIVLIAISLVSCEQKHSPEYYQAIENYNKAHESRLKADSLYEDAVMKFQDSVLNKGK